MPEGIPIFNVVNPTTSYCIFSVGDSMGRAMTTVTDVTSGRNLGVGPSTAGNAQQNFQFVSASSDNLGFQLVCPSTDLCVAVGTDNVLILKSRVSPAPRDQIWHLYYVQDGQYVFYYWGDGNGRALICPAQGPLCVISVGIDAQRPVDPSLLWRFGAWPTPPAPPASG